MKVLIKFTVDIDRQAYIDEYDLSDLTPSEVRKSIQDDAEFEYNTRIEDMGWSE